MKFNCMLCVHKITKSEAPSIRKWSYRFMSKFATTVHLTYFKPRASTHKNQNKNYVSSPLLGSVYRNSQLNTRYCIVITAIQEQCISLSPTSSWKIGLIYTRFRLFAGCFLNLLSNHYCLLPAKYTNIQLQIQLSQGNDKVISSHFQKANKITEEHAWKYLSSFAKECHCSIVILCTFHIH